MPVTGYYAVISRRITITPSVWLPNRHPRETAACPGRSQSLAFSDERQAALTLIVLRNKRYSFPHGEHLPAAVALPACHRTGGGTVAWRARPGRRVRDGGGA